MKHFLLFAFSFISCISTRSQTIDSVRVKDSWDFTGYDDTPVLQIIDSFSSGLIQSTLQRWWIEQDWQNQQLTSYQYDVSFNLTQILIQRWINGVWTNSDLTINAFDGNNRKISVDIKKWESNQWTTTSISDYVYDLLGNILLITSWSDPGLQDGTRVSHYYDAMNRDTLAVIERFENGMWVSSSQTHFQYDTNSNVVFKQTDSWICFWTPQQKEEMAFTPTNHLVSHAYFIWDSFLYSWRPYTLTTYYPDSFDNDTLLLGQYWSGGLWENRWRTINSYSYFPDHYCLDRLEQEFYSSHWTTLGQSTSCFDTSGKILSSGSGSSSHTYTYNQAGDVTVYHYFYQDHGGSMISGADSTFYLGAGGYHISLAGDLTICAGDSLPLGVWVSGSQSSLSYQWSPATGLNSNSLLNPTASPDSTINYSLTVLDNAVPVGSYVVHMSVSPVPDAQIILSIVDTISLCSSAVLISDTLISTSNCYWYRNGIQQGTQWGNSCTLPIDENGQYILETSNSFGCYAFDTLDISFFNHPAPQVTIIQNCNQLIATSPTATSFQWYRSSSPVAGAVNDTFTVASGSNDYKVLVTDADGCTNFSDYLETNAMTVYLFGYPQCHDSCSGWLEAIAYAGAAPYSFLWSTGDTTFHVDNLCPSVTYTVTVTDTRGCSVTEADSLINPTPIVSNLQSGFVSDIDSCDALAIAFPTGGIGGQYYYEWSNGSHQQYTQLCYGWNTVTICRNNYCMITDSVFVTLDSIGFICDISANAISPLCGGSCEGSITAVLNSGTQPCNYLWSNGSTQSSIFNLCNGTYNLFVLDSNGCADSTIASISSPPALSAYANIISYNPNDPCSTLVEAVLSGGVIPYSQVQWCNGALGNQAYMCPGLCMVYFSDSLGCVFNDSVLIPVSVGPSCSTTAILTNASFGQCNGSATVIPNGTAPYSWSWSTADTTALINNLCPGIYYYTVTDSFGCSITDSIIVAELPPGCSVTIISANNICNGDCTGSLTAVANGVPPFHFLWNTGDTTATIDSLCSGSYSVSMTDSAGCIATANGIVTELPPLLAVFSTVYLCDSCITVGTVTGGTPPYLFNWCDGSIDPELYLCVPGLCVVTVVDANACLLQDTVILNPPPPLTLNVQTTGTSCTGCSDGSVISTASGGQFPYTFIVSPGNLTCSACTNLPAGIITVCVTDANNCTVCVTDTIEDDPTGISAFNEFNTVNVFPNPFIEETVLEVNPEILKQHPEFILTDVLGKKIVSIQVNHLKTVIPGINLTGGVYFYQVSAGSKTIANGKLVVVN